MTRIPRHRAPGLRATSFLFPGELLAPRRSSHRTLEQLVDDMDYGAHLPWRGYHGEAEGVAPFVLPESLAFDWRRRL